MVPLLGLPLLVVCALGWAAPTLWALAREGWTTDLGPSLLVMLPVAAWLIVSQWPRQLPRDAGGRPLVVAALVASAILLNLMSWIVGVLIGEVIAIYLAGIALIYARGGAALCRRLWFPIVFALAALPLPNSVIGPATLGLKLLVAEASVQVMALLGFDVARGGTIIYIDQYELVVEAACSGLNSIVSLTAIGLLYAWLHHRGSAAAVALLGLAAIPIALLANLVRIVLLGAIVSRWGIGMLDTPLHGATGVLMFGVATALLMATDWLATRAARRWRQ